MNKYGLTKWSILGSLVSPAVAADTCAASPLSRHRQTWNQGIFWYRATHQPFSAWKWVADTGKDWSGYQHPEKKHWLRIWSLSFSGYLKFKSKCDWIWPWRSWTMAEEYSKACLQILGPSAAYSTLHYHWGRVDVDCMCGEQHVIFNLKLKILGE